MELTHKCGLEDILIFWTAAAPRRAFDHVSMLRTWSVVLLPELALRILLPELRLPSLWILVSVLWSSVRLRVRSSNPTNGLRSCATVSARRTASRKLPNDMPVILALSRFFKIHIVVQMKGKSQPIGLTRRHWMYNSY